MDVPRLSLKKTTKGLLIWVMVSSYYGSRYALFSWILCAMLLSVGCHNKMQVSEVSVEKKVMKEHWEKVSFPKIILRFEGGLASGSKIAELNFDFYGRDLKNFNIESQKTEIRNLILIHFANSDLKKIPTQNSKIQDPILSEYLNQFLRKGRIEQSEYQLVRVY